MTANVDVDFPKQKHSMKAHVIDKKKKYIYIYVKVIYIFLVNLDIFLYIYTLPIVHISLIFYDAVMHYYVKFLK